MKVDGTFIGGAATAVVKLKILSPDGASYLDVGPDVTFSAEGVGAFLAGEDTLRVDISTATVSGLYCTIDLLPD